MNDQLDSSLAAFAQRFAEQVENKLRTEPLSSNMLASAEDAANTGGRCIVGHQFDKVLEFLIADGWKHAEAVRDHYYGSVANSDDHEGE